VKAVVLGGSGVVGDRVSRGLAARDEVTALVIAGRNRPRIERTVHRLRDKKVATRAATVDVTDHDEVARLAEGADVVVSCAGPFLARDASAAEGAIKAGVPYVSLGDDLTGTRKVLELNDFARAADVTVVTGCGFSPGITGLLVALAARDTTAVDDVEISIALSLLDSKGRATAVHFLTALAEPAGMVFDHAFVQEPPASAPRLVFFPAPIGWVETFRCSHPEILSLLESYPAIRSLQSKIGLEERAAMDLARVAAVAGVGRSERLTRAMLRLGRPVRPVLDRVPPKGARCTGVRVDVRGRDEGRTTSTSFGVADRFVVLASLPLVQAGIELGTRHVNKAGVHTPDRLFDPSSFLGSLIDRGLRIMRLEPNRL
jgi:lysine 6-dehydrogenase